MIKAKRTSIGELEAIAAELGMSLPIEQTGVWAEYQATVDGRTPWGCVELSRDGRVVALASFCDYQTHGYHYLRGHHAPVWAETPSAEDEREAIDAIRRLVRSEDRS